MASAHFTSIDAAAVLIVLAGALGWVNHRSLRFPASIGLTQLGALASLVVADIDRALPASDIASCGRCSTLAGWRPRP